MHVHDHDAKLVGRQGAGYESIIYRPLSRCLTFVVLLAETAGIGLGILPQDQTDQTDRLYL